MNQDSDSSKDITVIELVITGFAVGWAVGLFGSCFYVALFG